MRLLGLILLLGGTYAVAKRDPYKILGLPKSAQKRRIKQAFREQSKKYHPDRNQGDPKAEEKFKDAVWAHDVLTNDTLRGAFDRGGEDAVNSMQEGRPRNPGGTPFFMHPGGGFPFMFFQGGHPHASGGGFPGGGFPGGGFPSGAFPGGGRGGPMPRRMAAVDWFENSPVELHIPGPGKRSENVMAGITEEMTGNWPDVFFIFRTDNQRVELAAKAFALVADELDSYLSFSAIDCRLGSETDFSLCHLASPSGGSRTPAPVEYLMANKAELLAKRPSSRGSSHTDEILDSEALMMWILDSAPLPPVTISTMKALDHFVQSAATRSMPAILLISWEESNCEMKLRRLAAEQSERAMFAVLKNTKSAQTFRRRIFDLAGIPEKTLEKGHPFMMLIADAQAISENTVLYEEFENEIAVDLTLAKFVGLAKSRGGIYTKVNSIARRLSAELMELNGECTIKDSRTCILWVSESNGDQIPGDVMKAYTDILAEGESGKAFRIYHLFIKTRKDAEFASKFGFVENSELVVYKPKRRKYVKYEKSKHQTIANFFEQLRDGALLLQEGVRLTQLPTLA